MSTKHRFRPFIDYPYDWVILGYFILALVLMACFHLRIDFYKIFDFRYDVAFFGLMLLYLVIIVCVKAIQLRRGGTDSFIFGSAWRHYVREHYFNWQRLVDSVRILVLFKLVLLIYCNIKQAIPVINSSLYDSTFLAMDRYTHFGLNPNQVLGTLFGDHVTCMFFDILYITWYVVKPFALCYFIMVDDRRLQVRFFGAFFCMWIFGGLMAVALPTLGPVYVWPDWFAHLHKPMASGLQNRLMAHYQQVLANPESYQVFIYEGIAAFPSLHVGIVALFAIFLVRKQAFAGWLMWGYTVIILLGSVLLGWHYAVDGYFTIGLAFLLYYISGKCFVPKYLRVSCAGGEKSNEESAGR